jgi:hypothetical protein
VISGFQSNIGVESLILAEKGGVTQKTTCACNSHVVSPLLRKESDFALHVAANHAEHDDLHHWQSGRLHDNNQEMAIILGVRHSKDHTDLFLPALKAINRRNFD